MTLPVHHLRSLKYTLQGKWRAAHLPTHLLNEARGKLVLCYHGIDLKNDTSRNTKFRSAKKFEEELRLLQKHTHIISLYDLATNNNLHSDKLNVAVTFDDGFLNNYELAKPILEKLNAPATFFITPIWHQQKNILWPDLVDEATPFAPSKLSIAGKNFSKNLVGRFMHCSGIALQHFVLKQNREFLEELYKAFLPFNLFMQDKSRVVYWKLMNDEQVRELAQHPLFEIGSHGFSHTSLPNLSDEEALDELVTSKNILEEITGKPMRFFAPPFGAYDERTILLTRRAGYIFQAMGQLQNKRSENETDIFPRFIVNPYLSPPDQLMFIANKGF